MRQRSSVGRGLVPRRVAHGQPVERIASLATCACLLALARCSGDGPGGAPAPAPTTPVATASPAAGSTPAAAADAADEAQQAARAFYASLAALQAGDLSRADEKLAELEKLAPGEMAAHGNRGVLELRRGKLDEARHALERARTLAPESAEVEALLGLVESHAGRSTEAIASLERAIALDPSDLRSRHALAVELERHGGPDGGRRSVEALDAILAADPGNLPVLLDRARAAAVAGDMAALRGAVERLRERSAAWPALAKERLEALAAATDPKAAGTAAVVLRNVLVRDPAFQRDLAKVAAPRDSLGREIERPLTLPLAAPTPAEPDAALAFEVVPRTPDHADMWGDPAHGRCRADLDHDFELETITAGEKGLSFGSAPVLGAPPLPAWGLPAMQASLVRSSVWAADVDSDGDLDLVGGGEAVVALRNGADRSFVLPPWTPFGAGGALQVGGLAAFSWADVDGDGDPDGMMIERLSSALLRTRNERGGSFELERRFDRLGRVVALAVAQLVGEANVDVAVMRADGSLGVVAFTPESADWRLEEVSIPGGARPFQELPAAVHGLFLADLDNNGAQDWVVSSGNETRIMLVGAEGPLAPRAPLPGVPISTRAVGDADGDGALDLLGLDAGGKEVVARGKPTKGYHWLSLELRAQDVKGDQRINTFGIGGEVEVRAGLHWQKLPVESPRSHFGLGTRERADLVRVVWPNGSVQAEHDLAADAKVVAEQRLKGSCPWLFAWDGRRMAFVTDVLWSSPLGLRINAQDTAGVVATEDHVKVPGAALAPRDGRYELAITAELWETHFFDHVALLVLDHPAGTELHQDERFSIPPPSPEPVVTGELHPVSAVRDDRGNDVTALVAARDGRYLGGFGKGRYQGVAEHHSVAFELPDVPGAGPLWLVGQGWTHPTDSSINVAMAQGNHPAPRGLSMELLEADGSWRETAPKLWFLAGKNKTMLVDVSAAAGRTVRLSTNLEIYWDALAAARGRPDVVPIARRLAPVRAELRGRGYSRTTVASPESPEIPDYEQLAGSGQRWRDLVGLATAPGDVRELLDEVDDRYVILNAGDEIVLSFEAPAPPAPGLVRDFVFVSDGWEKDGDLNTGFGKTVLPLPSHDDPAYRTAPRELEDDRVFARHPEDWVRFHTRYVAPDAFREALRPRSVVPPS